MGWHMITDVVDRTAMRHLIGNSMVHELPAGSYDHLDRLIDDLSRRGLPWIIVLVVHMHNRNFVPSNSVPVGLRQTPSVLKGLTSIRCN